MIDVAESRREWLRVRARMTERHVELARAAAADYCDLPIVDGTDLLVRPEWLPTAPIPLDQVELRWQPDADCGGLTGREAVTAHVRPYRTQSARYETYADAIGDLVKPPIFENRLLYRLIDADLRDSPLLSFGRGRYFDTLNV